MPDTNLTDDEVKDMDSTMTSDVLAMSDEDFLKGPVPVVQEAAPEVVAEATDTPDEDEGEAPATEEANEAETPEGGDEPTEAAKAEPGADKEADKVEKEGDKEAAPAEAAAPVIDYKAEYEKLTAPFKANGKDIQVASVDDAIQLMQMGANYNKKMAALKPNLKLMKLLENNGLLSEEKLSFLIDLDKKDPGAINKLVKDSGIDPMELDAEKASAYRQNTYKVDDQEVELDTVLEEIQGSPSYTRTLEVVGNKWDVASKQVVAKAPQLLKIIDSHVASGIYDLISTEVERERMFGRLQGVSDIEAYRQVGDAIQARGGFNHLAKPSASNQAALNQPAPVIVQPKPKVDDGALKDKKRAAAPTKPAASTVTPADFNPLNMSDDEFAKMASVRFR